MTLYTCINGHRFDRHGKQISSFRGQPIYECAGIFCSAEAELLPPGGVGGMSDEEVSDEAVEAAGIVIAKSGIVHIGQLHRIREVARAALEAARDPRPRNEEPPPDQRRPTHGVSP